MESNPGLQNPDDPRSELAVADQARQRLADGLRLPTGSALALPVPADQRRPGRWSIQPDRPWNRGHVDADLPGRVRGGDVGRLRLALVARRGGGRGRRSGLRVRHLRWWHAYRHDPAAHAGGVSPRMLAALAALA